MAEDYEEIVRLWYNRLQPKYTRWITVKYPGLTLFDAENIYQDAFIAAHENLMQGRIKEDTSWSSYIMTICMNMASKAWRRIGKTDSVDEGFDSDNDDSGSKIARKVDELMRTMADEEDEAPLYKNEEALSLLDNEIAHTPEPCKSIIQSYYGNGWSMEEIAEEIGYKNSAAAKSKKSQCMSDLIKRVTDALNRAGFDVKPKRRNRNGKD